MEKHYPSFPSNTNNEPYPNSSLPQPQPPPDEQYQHYYYHHRHPPILPNPSSSSPSSYFHYAEQRPPNIIYPYLPYPPQDFMVGPPFNQSFDQPFWVGQDVQNLMPYSTQMVQSFSDHTNNNIGCNVVMAGMEIRAAPTASDAWTTKIARNKRKMARQRSLNLNTGSNSGDHSAPSPRSYYEDPGVIVSMHETNEISIPDKPKDPIEFITADNKKLKLILKKELKNSDVGSLGRIVVPKREAEEHLPCLVEKEGIQVVIRDIYSERGWNVKYKYWSNNKSRMYVLENTGEFVRENGLQIGDTIILYKDESHHMYFSINKAKKQHQIQEKSHQNLNYPNNLPSTSTTNEEDVTLAILIDQFNDKEDEDVTLHLMDYSSPSDSTQHQSFNCFGEKYDNNKNY
ncbi:hypothetical protein SAY87_030526 [Trapa incisa]|uniref:TF-B3 domain-containing protein n=1 Tax=Trapa incisa TaxID=236973 RepID=A0AAN7KRX8_9MYRT|nr:hypothetical protein SAY87_030526 [Trapa incisa]